MFLFSSSSSEISCADPQHFRERSAGGGGDLQHKMAFAKFGQKLAAEEGQAGQKPPTQITSTTATITRGQRAIKRSSDR